MQNNNSEKKKPYNYYLPSVWVTLDCYPLSWQQISYHIFWCQPPSDFLQHAAGYLAWYDSWTRWVVVWSHLCRSVMCENHFKSKHFLKVINHLNTSSSLLGWHGGLMVRAHCSPMMPRVKCLYLPFHFI